MVVHALIENALIEHALILHAHYAMLGPRASLDGEKSKVGDKQVPGAMGCLTSEDNSPGSVKVN